MKENLIRDFFGQTKKNHYHKSILFFMFSSFNQFIWSSLSVSFQPPHSTTFMKTKILNGTKQSIGIDRNRSLYAIMGIKVGSQLWEKRAVPLTGNP